MLVLSRKKDEKIMIGDNIWVQVIEVRGGIVRLGIHAPIEVEIHREEVYMAIHAPEEDLEDLAKLTEKAF